MNNGNSNFGFVTNRVATLMLAGLIAIGFSNPLDAQFSSATPDNQTDAMSAVKFQVSSLESITSNAGTFDTGQYQMVWMQFQALRREYYGLKATLSQQQLQNGANQWAELDSGLGILQEAFSDYQSDVNNGQDATWAFKNMCQVLGEAAEVWFQEFKKDCDELQVGW
jgi:hypothetical protein